MLEVARVRSDAKLPCVLHQKPIGETILATVHVPRERSSSYRVHLSQHGPVGEELRLPGVHDDQVEEGAPGLVLKRNRRKTLAEFLHGRKKNRSFSPYCFPAGIS